MISPLDRRSFLRGAGMLGGLALANLPPWPTALAATPPVPAPADFVAMSAAFLGVTPDKVAPPVSQDGYTHADLIYTTATQGFTVPAITALTALYVSLAGGSSPASAAQAMITSGGATGCQSRIIYLMYLLGVWYAGTEIANNPGSAGFFPPLLSTDMVVSSRAYKEGWAWRMAQAHPMGFSQFNFGSWADTPPSLADFGF